MNSKHFNKSQLNNNKRTKILLEKFTENILFI